MKTSVFALVLLAASCAAPTSAPAPARTTSAGTAVAEATVAFPGCGGAISAEASFDTPVNVPTIAGATRFTIFVGTHTHGDLVRVDGVTFAHHAGLVRELRAALPDPSKSLFLGNGDDMRRDLCGVDSAGKHVIDAFNAGGLDANTFGFNEVAPDVSAVGPTQLRELVAASRFIWVSANVLELDKSDVFAAKQGARRWIVKDVGGIKVGLTGLIVPEPAPGFTPPSYGRDLAVIDPVEAMRQVLPLMRRDGAQLIVVLSHMDALTMERVANEVEGVDAIVGSHIGYQGLSKVVKKTILADGFDNMHQVAQLDLLLKDGAVVGHALSLHAIRRTSRADPAVTAVLTRYLPALK